jgi:tetratricopeptide (TPR) repeat protein
MNIFQALLAKAGLYGRPAKALPSNLSADELMKHAYEFIDSCDYESAFVVGQRLNRIGFSGGCEINAKTHAADGNFGKAVHELEKGLRHAPHVWILWELLGNYRSELGEYEAAMQCYDKALGLPDADLSSINLNRSICLFRQDKPDLALSYLDAVTSVETAVEKELVRMGLLVDLKRYNDCITVGESLLSKLDTDVATEEEQTQLGRGYGLMSRAFLSGLGDREKAKEAMEKSTRFQKANSTALAVRRELDDVPAGGAKIVCLAAFGEWDQPLEDGKPVPGFVASYRVLASSPEEALSFARLLEPEAVRASMQVSSTRTEEPEDWQTLKGVYWCLGGYTFFIESDD